MLQPNQHTRWHTWSHIGRSSSSSISVSNQAEVAEFIATVFRLQNIMALQVTMDDCGRERMQVFQGRGDINLKRKCNNLKKILKVHGKERTAAWKFSAVLRLVRLTWRMLNKDVSQSSIMKHRFGGFMHAPKNLTILEWLTRLITKSSSMYSCFKSALIRASKRVFKATGWPLHHPWYTIPTPPPPIRSPSSISLKSTSAHSGMVSSASLSFDSALFDMLESVFTLQTNGRNGSRFLEIPG